MEKHNIQEEIEHFLIGRLSVDEILEFQKKLDKDPEFRQQFEEHKMLYEGIKFAGRRKLMKRMQRLEEELDVEESQQAPTRIFSLKKVLAFAAGIALVLVITFVIKLNLLPDSSDQSFAQSVGTYPSDIIQRSPVIDVETLARINQLFPDHAPEKVYEAFLAYEGKNYTKAIQEFDNLLADKESSALTFYKGQALFGNDQPEEAIKEFNAYLQTGEKKYNDPSIFYKGLALIKIGKTEEARQLWDFFSTQDCFYCGKAKQKLDSLKK